MVTFKSFNNIVLDMLNQLRLSQPNLDTKPNSVARDLFVDAQALQISNIYELLREISALQSIMNVTGQDLTNYGSNYGITRQTGTKSTGTVVFTFRSIDTDITIPEGSVVRTRGGTPFLTISSVLVLQSQANALRATATRLRQELNTASITDEFAVEVSVQAQSQGTSGNVSSYSIISHSVASVNSITNTSPFSGGTDLESDAAFRSRILATFAGANVGTALGYRSVVLNLAEAIDALVVEPGDPLMIRDGTTVYEDSDGNLIVSEPGTGGRVDVYIMGENNQSGIDSFVFYDQSGANNPTHEDNDFVLGHSTYTADTSLTLNSRRVSTLAGTADVPNQPISEIVSVSGSVSGPNFVEQYLDTDGNLKGNFTLVKDTGYAGGSAFGLDKLRWTSDNIVLENEAAVKGALNSIDGLTYTDVLSIPAIRQDVQITNENSAVLSSSRAYITTNHKPVRTVNRVFNLTTGERYVITDQTPDDTGDINTSGRVKISGRTLPTVSDILQVDYTWIFEYDPYIDFDNFDPQDPLDEAQDSVEWGFSNYIRDEDSTAVLDSYGNLRVEVDYLISRVLSVNSYRQETLVVTADNTIITSYTVTNIHSIKDLSLSGDPEIFNTFADDGNFSNLLITLPTDTLAQSGDTVLVTYSLNDIMDIDGYSSGTFVNDVITLNPSTAVPSGTSVKVNYVTNFLSLLGNTDITSLPLSGDGANSFFNVDGYQPVQNVFSGTTVVSNQRRSPSNLKVTTSSLPSDGTLRIVGTTFNKVDSIMTVTADDTIDLAPMIREAEGWSSTYSIPAEIYVARIILAESVILTVSEEISSVVNEYDLTNYSLQNARWDRANAIELSSLSKTKFRLASTTANNSVPIITGTQMHIIFYYVNTAGTENLFYSKNGNAITDRKFAYISSINRVSGFQDSGGIISGKFQFETFNQPIETKTYYVDYNYTAPKENERITINFEYNKLITDATEAIEERRPVTADVLVKSATKIELDVEAKVIVLNAYKDQTSTVQQDVADNISSTLSADSLGTTLDSSDIINNIYNVSGVDRVRITRFNKTGETGTKLSITAQKSEYLAPGGVDVDIEER